MCQQCTGFHDGTGETTRRHYVNRNNQRCCSHQYQPGTDSNQLAYRMVCQHCNYDYGANGSDIHERRCPVCQGGQPGIRY